MKSEKVFSFFDEIAKIPRESGHEEMIIQYLRNFANSAGLACHTDEAGNVLILKSGTKGMENAPTVILQSHSDMVCEKNNGNLLNFDTDPIRYVMENGWLTAKETTLGADCGIGMAAQLAILAANDISHGPLEVLFTTSEETGMDGAKALKPDFLKGEILINLDSEDEGELFIGCAGGLDTTAIFNYKEYKITEHKSFFKAGFYGAVGGHSGDDIEKERANANRLLMRFLYKLSLQTDFDLCHIDGGNKRNAIAREAYAVIAVDDTNVQAITTMFQTVEKEIRQEYKISDPDLYGKIEVVEKHERAIEKEVAQRLVLCLNGMLHGVIAMSLNMPGLVETSTNFASIKMEKCEAVRVGTSQRSSVDSARINTGRMVESLFRLAGAEVSHENEYSGWKPDINTPLLALCTGSYKSLFGNMPVVRAIHAGLECGIFAGKYPQLDMISFGPTIKGVHAPGERLEIDSVEKFWLLLTDVIANIK